MISIKPFYLFVVGILLVLVLVNEVVAAPLSGGARATWTTPTTYEDGKSLVKSHIAKYELRYKQQNGTKRGIKNAKAGTNGYLFCPPIRGYYLFNIRVVLLDGRASAWSNDVLSTVPACVYQ